MPELPRWRRFLTDPWGQMVIYLVVFLLLGFAVAGFFHWVRGPEKSPYTPFNEADPPVTVPRR